MQISKKIIWILLSLFIVISLVLVSCGEKEVEEEEEEGPPPMEEEGVVEEEEEEGPPVTGDWWDKFGEPEYGGTFTFRESRLAASFDMYNPYISMDCWSETLIYYDWTMDRDDFSCKVSGVSEEHYQGWLLESWEWQDSQTLILHVKEGITWWDKAPANGREFVAEDIQFHYDRLLGTGSGFIEQNPFIYGWVEPIEKVTATDKYTAVMKFKNPGTVSNFWALQLATWIESPDAVREFGDLTDWRNALGTGAYMPTDYIAGGSLTLEKNPNYWGFDERHPENQLPYVDHIKILAIPDIATAIAALRTGKIDLLGMLSWEQAASIARTNPDLVQSETPSAFGYEMDMRCDNEPFTDINVRKALQMAIDRETIAATHYGGTVDGKPCGILSTEYKGYVTPYDEWPQELKDEYSYNPERARELLAEAGYPDGFKTHLLADTSNDLDLIQIIKAQFLDIGVDMEVEVLERPAAIAKKQANAHPQLGSNSFLGQTRSIRESLYGRYSKNPMNYIGNIVDEYYDGLYEQFTTVDDFDEAKRLALEMDMYAIKQHWDIVVCPVISYSIWQPYVKGYSGEGWGPRGNPFFWAPRMWVDQDLKKSMVD